MLRVVDVTIGNADLENGYLKVMGKGGKERIVPVGSSVQKILQRYVYHFRPEPSHLMVENVFLTIEGKPLTINGVKLLFRRLAKKSGVKRLHVHLCRHTFATNYLINGGEQCLKAQACPHSYQYQKQCKWCCSRGDVPPKYKVRLASFLL